MVPIGGLRIGPRAINQAEDRMRLAVVTKVVGNKTIQPRDQGQHYDCFEPKAHREGSFYRRGVRKGHFLPLPINENGKQDKPIRQTKRVLFFRYRGINLRGSCKIR